MDQNGRKNQHLILEGFTEAERFQSTQQGGPRKTVPERNRRVHGTALLGQVEELKPELAAARLAQEEAGLESGFGLRVEFESFPDVTLAFESLARERQGIELLNVREEGQHTNATVLYRIRIKGNAKRARPRRCPGGTCTAPVTGRHP